MLRNSPKGSQDFSEGKKLFLLHGPIEGILVWVYWCLYVVQLESHQFDIIGGGGDIFK